MPAPTVPGMSTFQASLNGMSDSQLRQTINQLSTAAAQSPYTTFRAPAPHATTSVFEAKQWSATPTAAKGSSRQRNRQTRAGTGTSTPTPAPQYAQNSPYAHHAQQAARPASTSVAPPVPAPGTFQHHPHQASRSPLRTTPQALTTTYASRLRTGATLLVQPILASTSGGGPAGGRTGTRRGGVINYAEPNSGDEIEPDAGERERDSDDSDFVASGGLRSAVRATRTGRAGGFYQYNFQSSHQSSPAPQGKLELDQSYLGMVPPAKFITSKRAEPTKHEYPSQEALENQALRPTAFVPIRVEFETDTHRVRDCFVWDLNDDLVKPEAFARIFCTDLDLPPNPWAEMVANQIRAQIEEHEGIASMDLGSGIDGYVEEGAAGEMDLEVPECRVILSIDVQIAAHHLMDHIEWDLLSPLTPEAFAQQLCADIGLTGEAAPLVAHALHEEILKHKKDALEWGVIGGDVAPSAARDSKDAGEDPAGGAREKTGAGFMKDKTGLGLSLGRAPRDGLGRGPRALRSVWKDWNDAEEYATRFEVLTAEEVERREIERERASRRLRRETSKFQFSSTRTRRR